MCLLGWWLLPRPQAECGGAIEPYHVVGVPSYDASETELHGQKTFKSLCASCHKFDLILIGPALMGVEERWVASGEYQGISGRDWLKRYIRNWQDPVKAGYPYALKMVQFHPSAMTSFPQLSDEDIEAILTFLKSPLAKPNNRPVI